METDAEGRRSIHAHAGRSQSISAGDDVLSIRPVALPCYDLTPEEHILAELEVTVLVAPKVHRTSHLLLSVAECDRVISSLTTVRHMLDESLTQALATANRAARPTGSHPN